MKELRAAIFGMLGNVEVAGIAATAQSTRSTSVRRFLYADFAKTSGRFSCRIHRNQKHRQRKKSRQLHLSQPSLLPAGPAPCGGSARRANCEPFWPRKAHTRRTGRFA